MLVSSTPSAWARLSCLRDPDSTRVATRSRCLAKPSRSTGLGSRRGELKKGKVRSVRGIALWARQQPRSGYIVAVAVALATLTVYVGTDKPPNALAASILQAVTILLSVFGSYEFGKASARQAARDLIAPHASSAFRRMLNLYRALGRQNDALAAQTARLQELEDNKGKVEMSHVAASLYTLRAMVIEQIATADDAMSDWRDIVPDEVARIEREAEERAAHNDG